MFLHVKSPLLSPLAVNGPGQTEILLISPPLGANALLNERQIPDMAALNPRYAPGVGGPEFQLNGA